MINNIISLLVITNISVLSAIVTIACAMCHHVVPFNVFKSFAHLCDSGTFITMVATTADSNDKDKRY